MTPALEPPYASGATLKKKIKIKNKGGKKKNPKNRRLEDYPTFNDSEPDVVKN